jgi:hypothetical protein
MRKRLIKGEYRTLKVINDLELVGSVCADLNSIGRMLICERCGDIEALIIAFLMFEYDQQAWPLCGPCLRELTRVGAPV